MPIDSEQKRKSAATVGLIWMAPAVIPDGAFDQADRQHIGWSYSGILASLGIIPWLFIANARSFILVAEERDFVLQSSPRSFIVTARERP